MPFQLFFSGGRLNEYLVCGSHPPGRFELMLWKSIHFGGRIIWLACRNVFVVRGMLPYGRSQSLKVRVVS